jgi:hypothetical protein
MNPMEKEELRAIVKDNLDTIVTDINDALSGKTIAQYEETLTRLGRGGLIPHWYEQLAKAQNLPNLDGKTVGSIIEMLLVAVIENKIFRDMGVPPLRINPARGVDLPDLNLGIKSPSENYCTSEPFFTAYERLMGNEYDAVILLTDYQTAKLTPPLKLQIIKWKYLSNTEIADSTTCNIAREHREWLLRTNETGAQKIFRFLAYVNQSDWRARHLLKLVANIQNDSEILKLIQLAREDYEQKNKALTKKDYPLIAEEEIEKIEQIQGITPLHLGVINAVDDWVVEVLKEAARMPNENEWNRLKEGPLNGQIGMSFALQWRYNFSRVFGVESLVPSEVALPS